MSDQQKINTGGNFESLELEIVTLIKKATTLHQQANISDAQTIYEHILTINPNHFDALQLLGVLFAQVKKYSQAVKFLSKAIKINPNHARSFSNLGIALKELKQFEEALASYDQAIIINPDISDFYSNRGNVLNELTRFDEALASYDQAINIEPDFFEAHLNRGHVLEKLKRFDEALASYDQAIILNPNQASAFNDRGNVLRSLEFSDKAINNYEKAIAINPDYAEAYFNRGVILQEAKLINEAIDSYGQAIKINSDYVAAHWNLAICNLMVCNFNAGWQGYEWRWRHPHCDSEPLKSSKPPWNFKKTDQRLFVWAEQGIGDHIFFGNLLSELLEDVPNLLVQIDKRLIPLFARSLPKIKFYPSENRDPNSISKVSESDYDIHVPIASLGKYLRSNEKDFGCSRDFFLKDNKDKTLDIKKELMVLAKSKNKICGISWRSKSIGTGADKTISLKYFIKALNLEGYTFVSLQYGKTKDEINEVKDELGINIISYEKVDNFIDIDGLASLIKACDVVISIDNVTCQLAGALGKKIHILLTYRPYWTWILGVMNHHLFISKDSLWYPSVKLYKQEKLNDWSGVLKKLSNELKIIN